MAREEPESLTDIREFAIQFYAILRRKFSEWSEVSIESDLGMRFAILMEPSLRHSRSCFFKHCF